MPKFQKREPTIATTVCRTTTIRLTQVEEIMAVFLAKSHGDVYRQYNYFSTSTLSIWVGDVKTIVSATLVCVCQLGFNIQVGAEAY